MMHDPRLFLKLADAHARLGHPDEVLGALAQAVDHTPNPDVEAQILDKMLELARTAGRPELASAVARRKSGLESRMKSGDGR